LRGVLPARREFSNNVSRLAATRRDAPLGACHGRLGWLQSGFFGMKLRRHDLERGVAYGLAEELTLFVLHLQEPARPAPSRALDGGIGRSRTTANASSHAAVRFDSSMPSSSGKTRCPNLR